MMWKTPSLVGLLGLVLTTTTVVEIVQARSNGAPTCINNRAAPGEDHKPAGFEQRQFEDSLAITVTLNGVALDPDVPLEVPLNTDMPFKVETLQNFKGIMARISGGDEDVNTRDVFILNAGETNLKINQECDLDIGGITHTNPDNKQVFECTMRFTEAATNMLLDLNIVETKIPVSRFYYDQYRIYAGTTAPPPGAPPTPPSTTPAPTPDNPPSAAIKSGAMWATILTTTSAVAAWTVVWTMMW